MAYFRPLYFIVIFLFLLLGWITGNVITYFHPSEKNTPDTQASADKTSDKTAPVKRPSEWTSRTPVGIPHNLTKQNDELKEIINQLQKGEKPDNWEKKLEEILRIYASPFEKQNALIHLFTLWARDNFEEAMTRASKLGGHFAHSVKREILCQLASDSPQKAFQFYEKNKEILSNHDYFMKEIAQNRSKQNPEEAWNWWCSLEQKSKMETLTAFFQGLNPEDTALMTGYVKKAHAELGFVPNTVIEYWANESPEAVLNWIDTKENKAPYLEAAISGIARNDLKKAEELLATLPNNKNSNKEFLIFGIAGELVASHGSAAALEWTMRQVPSNQLSNLLLEPLSSWTSSYQTEAKQWVQKLPPSPSKDIAISVYADSIRDVEFYDDAIELINSMENTPKKESALKSRAQKWEKQKPEDFKKWMNSSTNAEALKPYTQAQLPQ